MSVEQVQVAIPAQLSTAYRMEVWGKFGLSYSVDSAFPLMLPREGEIWRYEPMPERGYPEGLLARVQRIEWHLEASDTDASITVARVYTLPLSPENARVVDLARPDGVPRVAMTPASNP